MVSDAKTLRKSLQKFGLSNPAIEAAWPDWWSDEADGSASARNELRFSLSRKLGLDPRLLIDNDEPRFVWRDEAKYKRYTGVDGFEGAALTSFGVSLGRALLSATPRGPDIPNLSAKLIRESILANENYVHLGSLLSLCWSLGIPVVQLRIFPLASKRMCAMAVHVEERHAILVGHDSGYQAQAAFYVAHEIAHIVLGHTNDGVAIIEFADLLRGPAEHGDQEEVDADQFALELLTGRREPTVMTTAKKFVARQLAETAAAASVGLRIDPGTLILCLGYSTGNWRQAFAALSHLYERQKIWTLVNRVAASQLDFAALQGDYLQFVELALSLREL